MRGLPPSAGWVSDWTRLHDEATWNQEVAIVATHEAQVNASPAHNAPRTEQVLTRDHGEQLQLSSLGKL